MRGGSSGRARLIAACAVIWGLLLALFSGYGYEKTYRLWGVPVLTPVFYDFRLIPGMAETLRMGLDPTLQNPGDPGGRIFNYPRIWYLLAYTGLSQDDTLWMGIALLLLFFGSVFAVFKDIDPRTVPLLLLILFSPAAMLLYERGNVDLLIFALCAFAAALAAKRAGVSAALLLLASLLKLYPILGLGSLVFKGSRLFVRLALLVLVPLLVYLAWNSRNTQAAWSLTERDSQISYGVNVFAMQFRPAIKYYYQAWLHRGDAVRAANTLSYIGAGLVLVLSSGLGLRAAAQRELPEGPHLNPFWMGAGIYTGTFLLGNNWDYRLVFLAFMAPQLVEWSRQTSVRNVRVAARLVLGLAILSCWGVLADSLLNRPGLEEAYKAFFIVDEAANWGLFAGAIYLLAASLPGWVLQYPQDVLGRFKRSPAA